MAQHVVETGQRFTPAARRAVWEHTRAQPWLVNAPRADACFDYMEKCGVEEGHQRGVREGETPRV